MSVTRHLFLSIVCLFCLPHCKSASAPARSDIEPIPLKGKIYLAGCPALHFAKDGTFSLYSMCGKTIADWDGRSGTFLRLADNIILSESGRPKTRLTISDGALIWPERFTLRLMPALKAGERR